MKIRKKGPPYWIVMREGRTSKTPFPHPSRHDAETEAVRLAKAFSNVNFYVLRAEFKVVFTKEKLSTTKLRYKAKIAEIKQAV